MFSGDQTNKDFQYKTKFKKTTHTYAQAHTQHTPVTDYKILRITMRILESVSKQCVSSMICETFHV